MRDLVRHVTATLCNRRMLALHLPVNAVLLLGASLWLLIPEEHTWQVAALAFSALLIVGVFLWLHSGTLAYAANPGCENLGESFRPRIRKLVWMLVGLAILFWCMSGVDAWRESQPQAAAYLYKLLPSFLRPASGSDVIYRGVGAAIGMVLWFLLPTLLLPWVTAKVSGGKLLAGARALLHWQYWTAMALAALVGVEGTSLLLEWTPGHGLQVQSVSLVLRLVVAYILATAAWLTVAAVLGYFSGPPKAGDVPAVMALWRRLFLAPGSQGQLLQQHCLAVLRSRKLLALQIMGGIAMAMLTVMGPRADLEIVWQVAVEIVAGVVLLILFLWLHSGTLAYAADPVPEKFSGAFRFQIRRIAWLFLGLLLLVVLAAGWETLFSMVVKDAGFLLYVRDAVSWYALPCLLLPWTAGIVSGAGIRSARPAFRSWWYWAGMAVVEAVAAFLSNLLSVWSLGTGWLRNGVLVPIRMVISDVPITIAWVLMAAIAGYFIRTRSAGEAEDIARKATA